MFFIDVNFNKEVQMWLLGLADMLDSINEKLDAWPVSVYNLQKVPLQLVSHTSWNLGKSGFTLDSIQALLEGSPDMEYVLIDGRNETDMVRLNVCCGLIGQGLKE